MHVADKTVSSDSASTFRTLVNLWPYMWPAERPDLRVRVVWATALLVVAKLVLVVVPYFFKWATNALAGDNAAAPDLPLYLLAPAALGLPARPSISLIPEHPRCRNSESARSPSSAPA